MMKATVRNLGVLAILMMLVIPAAAQKTHAQKKLMAKRAAILDGQRQLLEMVEGVHIDSETTVKDFVTEKDEIYSRVRGVLKGAEVVETRYLEDGSCEVDMKLPVVRIRQALQVNFPWKGEVLMVTGVGVMGEDGKPVPPKEVKKLWYMNTVKATGSGVPPSGKVGTAQGKRMAELAARRDAQRNLLEQILGVKIDSETKVRDFVTESDKIRSKVEGFIRGAYIVEIRHLEDGLVEVDMEINLRGIRTIIYTDQGKYEVVK